MFKNLKGVRVAGAELEGESHRLRLPYPEEGRSTVELHSGRVMFVQRHILKSPEQRAGDSRWVRH